MTEELPPYKIAFVIDGKVVDVIQTDSRLAAIFLSEPVIVDITEKTTTDGISPIIIGTDYDEVTGVFTLPGNL